jgi:methyl-accepting chemotaxis protein
MEPDDKNSLNERLAFIGIDAEAKQTLGDLQGDIAASIGPALDVFYDSVRKVPHLMQFFSNEGHLQGAKQAQVQHWKHLAAGTFDENYVAGVTAVGRAHARIGLEPRWYIGGYAVLIEQLVIAIMKQRWPSRFGRGAKSEKLATQVSVVVKSALLDMDYAISVYLQILEDERRKSEIKRIQVEKEQALALEALATVLKSLSAGNLEAKIPPGQPDNFVAMAQSYNDAVENLRRSIDQVRMASEDILRSTGEIATATDNLAERTEQQAAGVEESSAALHELTESVTSTAKGAQLAANVVAETLTVAHSSGAVVTEAVGAMSEIEKSSSEISKIIGVIDEIAFQTNLLALNAGVEAARAGDAGRGFAVVAQEVRELAQRSAGAAREIKGIIQRSSSQVDNGVRLVNRSGESLTLIVDKVRDLNTIVADIARAAAEQSVGLREINEAIASMDTITQQNAGMVERTSEETRSLGNDVEKLTMALRGFQTRDMSGQYHSPGQDRYVQADSGQRTLTGDAGNASRRRA